MGFYIRSNFKERKGGKNMASKRDYYEVLGVEKQQQMMN